MCKCLSGWRAKYSNNQTIKQSGNLISQFPCNAQLEVAVFAFEMIEEGFEHGDFGMLLYVAYYFPLLFWVNNQGRVQYPFFYSRD